MRPPLFLSRSALEAYQTCPRLFFVTYQLGGRGIVPAKQSLDLADGIARHRGLQVLNLGGSINEAVEAADHVWTAETATGIEDVPSGREFEVQREHRAIVEAGIRIWATIRQPQLKADYDVVAVEKERSYWLKPNEVLFEGRPDADLRSKFNSTLYAYSLKNPRAYYRSRHPECLVDMQGRSELWLLGNEYGHDKMGGVLMDYVFTGKESKDSEDDGGPSSEETGPSLVWAPKIRWTPLTRGWFKDVPDGSRQFAWRYKYPNPTYDASQPWSKANCKQKTFAGGKRIAAWEYPGGVEAWVDSLLSHRLIPTSIDPMDDIAFMPPPYFRQPDQIASFLFKIVRLAEDIQEHLEALTPQPWSDREYDKPLITKHPGNLDYHFPQWETSCINKYGKKCRAWEFCHGSASRDPLNNGYKPRTPHHTTEAESHGLQPVRGELFE